ncbi:MAG: Hint domain-containing protein [Chloroflexota bacterium]
MSLRLDRVASLAILVAVLAALVAGCTGAASGSPSGSPRASPLTKPAAKEALLVGFGPLVYCDPDYYPVARTDESSAATDHLAEMRADTTAWAAIAARFGFEPTTVPSGDGLLAAYREWKMLRALAFTPSGDGWSFDARFGGIGANASDSSSVTHVVGTIATDGTIHVDTQEASGPPPCPICLARGTKIATPAGDVAVEALRRGDPVWTLDGLGRRVSATVVQVGSMPVPADHDVVHLVLADGRAVLVSPGHPLLNGSPIAALRAGDAYDGSVVVSADRIPYDGGRTFDLLPSGGTGVYWANGIELGSTLFR